MHYYLKKNNHTHSCILRHNIHLRKTSGKSDMLIDRAKTILLLFAYVMYSCMTRVNLEPYWRA